MWLVAAVALASAEVRFERTPGTFDAGDLEPAPLSTARYAYAKWLDRASERAVPKAIDAALSWRSVAVDTCLRDNGGTGVAVAPFTLAVAMTGRASVTVDKGADPVLGACLTEVFHGQPIPVPVRKSVKYTYTARWAAAAPADAAAAPADATAAPADAAAAPADAARSRIAFAPNVDLDRGFGDIAFGTPADAVEGLSQTSTMSGTTLYSKASDDRLSWLGAQVGIVRYAFGSAGFYAATVGVGGVDTAWKLREALTARYGQPRWDNRFGVHYWRGERALVELRPIPNSSSATVTIVDMEAARASGLADDFPGTPVDASNPGDDRRLPRIFRE